MCGDQGSAECWENVDDKRVLAGEGDLEDSSEHEEGDPVPEGAEGLQWSRCEDRLQTGYRVFLGKLL